MRSNVNFIPASRDIPPVSVYMEKIIPARRDIPPCRDGMKVPCKRKLKIVCVSIGSRGIPAKRDVPPRRDIPAKGDQVNRP